MAIGALDIVMIILAIIIIVIGVFIFNRILQKKLNDTYVKGGERRNDIGAEMNLYNGQMRDQAIGRFQ